MKITVLIVEDNPITMTWTRATLARRGYTVLAAEDGAAALELMQRQQPAVVVQDMLLPDIDGCELARRLQALAAGPSVPILAVSSLPARLLEARDSGAGFVDFLEKPLDAGRLVSSIEAAVASSQSSGPPRHAEPSGDARPALRRFLEELGIEAGAEDEGDDALLLRALHELERQAEGRKALESQLIQSQKMEAMGQLAGGIAHDFNNLLTAITGYSELLLIEMGSDDPRYEFVQEIASAGERAAALTRQLLAFSRKQKLHPRILGLNSVVSHIEKMLCRLIGEDIQLATDLDPELGRIEADPGQIEQVIVNLAVNARDAMPRGGTLRLETANVEMDELYARGHLGIAPGSYVMLTITDTGEGMSPEVRRHIFEPFFTTKESGKGTGLGLSTVYGIVHQSGGHIWVYSEVGTGTTFKIYFPRADAPDVQPIEPEPAEGSLPRGEETILLVEDELSVRSLMAVMLRNQGYSVLEASNGEQALELCRTHRGVLDLLVTDTVMPGMSGPEVVARAREICPELRVLFVSGYNDDTVTRHGLIQTDLPLLRKPFKMEMLAVRVRELLAAEPSRIRASFGSPGK